MKRRGSQPPRSLISLPRTHLAVCPRCTSNLQANALSARFRTDLKATEKKKVAIIGGGLSGLACAKYLSEAGHEPTIYEARDVLGGKVSAWQDKDGDWIETGLHIFFGAYPNLMNMFHELDIHDRLQWKVHKMIFAMQELPGEFTTFDFIPGIPAPFNFGLAILMNQKMLTLGEKLQTAPPLLPMLIRGQDFIEEQDELSVLDFMRQYGMPDRINEEVCAPLHYRLALVFACPPPACPCSFPARSLGVGPRRPQALCTEPVQSYPSRSLLDG